VIIPKGFFPQQDTGLITGISESSQNTSVEAMMRYQTELGAIVQKDPAVAHVAMALAVRLRGEQRPAVHHVEAARSAHRDGDQVNRPLRPQLAK